MALEYILNIKDNGSVTLNKVNQNVNILNQSLVKVDKTTNIFNKSIGFMGSALASMSGILLADGVAAIKSMAKEMVNSYDSAAKLSSNIGVASDSIVGLRHAAELSGVGAEAMDKNLAKLSKTISDAASGSKQAADLFKKMDISFENDKGGLKNAEEVMEDLADKFKDLPPGAERATLAMDLFGKSGANMVSMLKDGKEGLRGMVNEGKGAAQNVEGVAEAMQALNDTGTRAKAVVTGLIASFMDDGSIKSFIGLMDEVSQKLLKNLAETKYAAEQKKEMARLNKDGEMAELRILEMKKAEIELGQKSGKEKDNQIDQIEKEMATLRTKLQLDAEDINLMRMKAQAIALEKKAKEGKGLTDNEQYQLDVYKKQAEEIINKRNAIESAAKAAAEAAEKAKQSEAQALVDYDRRKKAEEDLSKAREAAAKEAAKRYADEGKRLDEWLAKYQQSKLNEKEIAKAAYEDEIKNFDALLARKKISETDYAVYAFQAHQTLTDKENEIDEKQKEDRIKSEEATQSKIWELRRISAKSYGETAAIEIEQIRVKYEKELKLAEAAKIDVAYIENAKMAELEAIRSQSVQNEIARAEEIRSYREIAAQTDDERMAYQMEAINNRYDMEVEKARGSAELIMEIEAARQAEIMRLDEQQQQMRIAQVEQYVDAAANMTQAIATLGKAGGKEMKAIAISQAIINTALAATKASTAAPWPANMLLVAGALAQGAVQIASIKSQKFYGGGMIPGSNTLIRANEEGREAILNTMAVRSVGGEAGVNALNGGYHNSTVNNNRTNNSTIVINTAIMTQKAYRDEIEPIMRRADRRR